ncbi:MAG: efflux RND transporter periplasmic adaptor subunit [Burkholderiaceae bacterium]|nr:efflux RND transporter periplasmic adaptor subunit [Burkholderiaceae bacterium]
MNRIPTPHAPRVGIVALTIGTATAMLLGCSEAVAPSPAAQTVYVTPVRLEHAASERRYTATLAPRVESEIAFRTGGKVLARLVDVGQRVRAGQPLARLDPADLALAVDAAAEQLRAAEVDANQAASDAARFQRLLADGSVGAADQERLQARADAAAARVVQSRRQLDLARNRSSYTTLVAPFDGVLTSRRFEAGQVVGEGQAVLTLARESDLEVVADIPERLAPQLRGQVASARVADGTPVALRLRELTPGASAATRTFRARYAIAQPQPAAWRIGMTAELLLAATDASDSAADLPATALVTARGEPAVWIVADMAAGRLELQPVVVVAQGSDRVRVSGLSEGALVVSAGAHKLDAGMRVRAVHRPLDEPLRSSQAVAPTASNRIAATPGAAAASKP